MRLSLLIGGLNSRTFLLLLLLLLHPHGCKAAEFEAFRGASVGIWIAIAILVTDSAVYTLRHNPFDVPPLRRPTDAVFTRIAGPLKYVNAKSSAAVDEAVACVTEAVIALKAVSCPRLEIALYAGV